ncbi:biosynthetic-type acetolactate synthase large subunit [Candidatus Palauibacter sp.]|uniref:biosynthetic-type acetolactate synthase large subunit n=1 Tax=Candidatus Palauibacter sp. TaxID=3101350 RepID=UPI003B023580
MEPEITAVRTTGEVPSPGWERDLIHATHTMSGAEALVRSLVQGGVRLVFGYPGGAIMPVYDALFDHGHEIRHVLVRHEQGSIHAAEGYARASGGTGVCIATSGPGATNLLTGIADAQMDSTPVVCITGQVASSVLGSDAFQETNVMSVSAPLTKWNHQITDPEEIPAVISKALYLARSGRPGPVLIDITKDAQIGTLAYRPHEEEHEVRGYEPRPTLDEERVEAACRLIDRSRRPLVLVGQGVLLSGAQKELGQFVEKAGLPFACTLLGLGAVTSEHPLYVGLLGMHGNYGPNIKTNECDLLIAVGMRFDDRVTGDLARYARQARVIHLDIDAAEIGKNVPADVEILADAREALGAMTTRVRSASHTAWLAEFTACHAIERERVIENDLNPASPELRMSEVMGRLCSRTEGRALVIADVGQHQMAAARYYRCRDGGAFITSGGLGTMGFALPGAMGVGLARRDRPVVAVIGDGGFQMTLQELGTIVKEQIPVKIMILNNGYLGMVRQWQELFFRGRYSQTELSNPDFVAIAAAYGMKGRRVSERAELDASIDEMLSSASPFLLDVIVEREENVFPMVPSGASCSEIRLE